MSRYMFMLMAVLFFQNSGLYAADEGEWVLYYEDQFDRDSLGPDWAVLNGEFKTVYDAPNGIGTLYAKGEALLLRRFPGDVRVEMEASSKEPGDLSIILAANERGLAGGYFLGFGSENNTISKILRLGKKTAIAGDKIIPDKIHKIVAEKLGGIVTLTVDGNKMQYADPEPLNGPAHEMIGLYFFNLATVNYVRVYGRKGQEPVKLTELPKTAGVNSAPKAVKFVKADKNLIGNPSFEEIMPGIRPCFPSLWVPEYSAMADRPQLFKDPALAHRGDRFIRLAGKGLWIKIHNIGSEGSGITLEPGKSYEFKAWARSFGGTNSAVEFQPGGNRFSLTSDWREFAVTWKAPENLVKHEMGFYLKAYGSVDIDDVSVCNESYKPDIPPELKQDRTKLKTLPAISEWVAEAGNPKYRERIALEVSELLGKAAEKMPAGISVAEVFGALPGAGGYDFVSPGKIRFIDGATGKEVLFKIRETDLIPGISQGDVMVFLADIPPLSRKIYYVYLVDREPVAEKAIPDSILPESLSDYTKEPGRLATETVKRDRLGTLKCERKDNKILFEITALPNMRVAGKVFSPEKEKPWYLRYLNFRKKQWDIVFQKAEEGPYWRSEFVLPEDAAGGIWQVALELSNAVGEKEKAEGAFAVEAGIWAGDNFMAIHSDDPPRPGKNRANIIAARGERESFQVVITAEKPLSKVKLDASELKQVNGGGVIPKENWKLERVEELFVGISHPVPVLRFVNGEFVNAGNYPDPLLPWREVNIAAGRQQVGLATIKVPYGIPAGNYAGNITGASGNGIKLTLPVNLRVYDFDLPKSPSFPVMICGTPGYVSVPQDREGRLGKDVKFYHFWDEEAADALAIFVAQKWMIPSLTGGPFGANAIPWTYDPQTRMANLDFTRFDKNAEILLNKIGVDFISIGAWNSGWKKVAPIYTYPTLSQWPSGWGTVYKDSPGRISKKLDTPEGLQMMEDYSRALGKHLEEKGWLDKVGIYIFDEPKSVEVNKAILETAKAIRRGHPQLKMLGAGYGFEWREYFDYIDVFTGQISPEVRAKMKEINKRYFGIYNQSIDFLAIPRALALYGWSDGWDGYYHHETTTDQDLWINPEPPAWRNRYEPKYAAGPAENWMLVGSSIYHWPEDELKEPLPAGKSRAWASSLRIEALRESSEDAEYLKILKDLSDKSPADSKIRERFDELNAKVKAWVNKGKIELDHNRYYNYRLDGKELQKIRRELCEAIEAAQHSAMMEK